MNKSEHHWHRLLLPKNFLIEKHVHSMYSINNCASCDCERIFRYGQLNPEAVIALLQKTCVTGLMISNRGAWDCLMYQTLRNFSHEGSVKNAIKENWKNYHYCLGRSPGVELSIGRYLTWLITKVPDHFMNLVVCTDLPSEGMHELIAEALAHFRSRNIRKLSWLAEEGLPAKEIKNHLLASGLTFDESFAVEMAADLAALPETRSSPEGLKILPVEDAETLRTWIHVASIGFKVPEEFEQTWYDFFVDAVFDPRFRTYLALLNGQPVGTSQLFVSAGVAGIYNVTCLPEARGQGIGTAVTLAPLRDAFAMGYRIGILQASEKGHRVYRRLGFQDFGKLSVYLWENDRSLGVGL